MRRILMLLMGFAFVGSNAQTSMPIIKSILIKANSLQVDELGNAYVVHNDNAFIKFNENGDSIANYISIANGEIATVDVTNPLRVMLYYSKFAKMVLLDRMLAPKNELNLRKLNLLNSNVIATSAEGNLWVYDQFNATLNKLDMELKVMIQGNDLRQQLSELPKSTYLIERDRKVYMTDSAQGIFIFDQYGTYLNTLSIFGVKKLQVVGNQIIYQKGDMLYSYDIKRLNETSMAIPQLPETSVIQAAYCRNVLYVLYQDRLVLYRSRN
ncbi:MAG: hypothetical protein V4561_08150 [Bacteroidota bacterium]